MFAPFYIRRANENKKNLLRFSKSMTLFVHRENQEILWQNITQSDAFQRTFSQRPPYESNEWFKNIIQMFYQESARQRIETKPALLEFNRQVLRYMLQDLSQRIAVQKPSNPLLNDRMITHNLQPSTMESKEEMHAREFAQRQREYDALLKRPEPPAPQFGDTVKDEVITNMDELIQQQLRMREQMVVSPQQQQQQPQQQQIQNVSNKLRIHNEDPTKTVTWKEPVIEIQSTPTYSLDALGEMKSEIGVLRGQMNEMQIVMKQMYDFLLTNSQNTSVSKRSDTERNDTERNDTERNDTERNDTERNDMETNTETHEPSSQN
jgi:hypothetical protein